jgi:SHAQKYF class myb-like DNA-binding protein
MSRIGGNCVNKIFKIRKNKRRGLLEKKIMRFNKTINQGRWTREEHVIFIKACLKHGANWFKIKEEVTTRTCSQIRSHGQKYLISLCKKYNIEIKSKRLDKFYKDHLNYPYKRKDNKNVLSIDRMTRTDRRLLKVLNFYTKMVNIEEIGSNAEKIFLIEKFPKTPLTNVESKFVINNHSAQESKCNNINICVNNINNDLFASYDSTTYIKLIKYLTMNMLLNDCLLNTLYDSNYGVESNLKVINLIEYVLNINGAGCN